MAKPIFQTDPYDRRVLLVSDKNDDSTYSPIHKEDGDSFVAEDPGLPVMLVDDDAKYRILRKSDLGGGGGTVTGTKSNNAVVPGATNLGTLPAIATAAAPTYTEGRQVGLSTNLAGELRTEGGSALPATATRSNVAGSTSTVTVLAANASRLGATVYNDSSAVMFLALGSLASTTSYTTKLSREAYYEVPFGYTGIITAVWQAATGNARVTELT